jgi:hypothetical protein
VDIAWLNGTYPSPSKQQNLAPQLPNMPITTALAEACQLSLNFKPHGRQSFDWHSAGGCYFSCRGSVANQIAES